MTDDIKLPPLHYDEMPEYGDAIPAMHAYARRAIEAVLQSPEIRELKKDAERLDKLEQDYFEPVEGGIRKHIDYQIEIDAETFGPKSKLKLVVSR